MGNNAQAERKAKLAGLGIGAGLASSPILIWLAGFGINGILAGSLAALIQSIIGNVAAGSLFAILTSIGMVYLTPVFLSLSAVALAGIIVAIVLAWKNRLHF